MQIWLGKQYLGQSDKIDNKQTNISLADLIVERDVSPNVDKYVEPHRVDQPRPIELNPLKENQLNDDSLKDYTPGSALDALLNSDKFQPKYFSHADQKEVNPFPDDDLDE